jgi:uncharacterized cupin superfamily protein
MSGMSERRHSNVVNLDEVQAAEAARGGFASRRRRLGAEANGNALGCSYIEVEPGKTAFPFHAHNAFEEGVYILEGTGTLRLGDQSIAVRAGDYVALLPGPTAAHGLTNTGSVTLRYLALSSPATPATMDIVTYPDSKKIAFAAGVDAKKGLASAALMRLIKDGPTLTDYYEDEPRAKE